MNRDKEITRKEFINKSCSGLAGFVLASNAVTLFAKEHATSSEQKLALRPLGKTGLHVSPIGFGASRTMEEALALEGRTNRQTGQLQFFSQHAAHVIMIIIVHHHRTLQFSTRHDVIRGEDRAFFKSVNRGEVPTGNAVAERFIETLNVELTWTRDWESIEELREAVREWLRSYNYERPHQALGWMTPAEKREENLGRARRAA